MVVTLDTQLPNEDELTVPELKLSGPALRAGAFHLGKYCQDTFNVSAIQLQSFSMQTTQFEPCTILFVWILSYVPSEIHENSTIQMNFSFISDK